MTTFHRSSHDPSYISSEMDKLIGRASDSPSTGESESTNTEQSFVQQMPALYAQWPKKASRKPRFIEHFNSIKLTKENLTALQASYKRKPLKPAVPIDTHFHSNPLPVVTQYRIKRKPLPESAAREEIHVVEDDVTTPSTPMREHGPRAVTRANTNFTDFLPCHQVRTWQQVDNEEYQHRRHRSRSTQSLSAAIALDGMKKKLRSNCNDLAHQSKKTGKQVKDVIKRHFLS